MDISRKRFVETMVGGSALLLFHGCGGGGSYGGGMPNPMPASGCAPMIAENHGHVLVIPLSDLDSASDKIYDIHGTADHTHSVTLIVQQLKQLKAGSTVTVTTSVTLAHTHAISVSCIVM
jgi:hypothetical protein